MSRYPLFARIGVTSAALLLGAACGSENSGSATSDGGTAGGRNPEANTASGGVKNPATSATAPDADGASGGQMGGSSGSGGSRQAGGGTAALGIGGTSSTTIAADGGYFPAGDAGDAVADTVTLAIDFVGAGSGVVTDESGSISCKERCAITVRKGTSGRPFFGRPVNGTGSYFGGFSGDCSGLDDCTLTMNGDKHLTADFRVQQHNFVFVSSKIFPNTLGGAVRYDDACNELATRAGINTATNDGYVAWTSDAKSLARDRLGPTARGFVRLDEKPVADQVSQLLDEGEIYYPIHVDETGHPASSTIVRTGTLPDGSASPENCVNYTSQSAGHTVTYGATYGGPLYWTQVAKRSCDMNTSVYCFGKTRSDPLTLERSAGKSIYLSQPFTPGTKTPDEACAANAPSGIGPVQALTAYANVSAASLLDRTARYVRPDGCSVGTGAEMLAAAAAPTMAAPNGYDLLTGIWQTGDGDYANDDKESIVWVGDIDMTRESPAGTCRNWTDATLEASGIVADYRVSHTAFWNTEKSTFSVGRSCSGAYRFYCIER